MDYQIPLDRLNGGDLKMAEMVNNIGNGSQRAVEEGMKSERLKTDLITNVSHDIKTPLTSIINYVDLLKRENFNDPKIKGYLDILGGKGAAPENINGRCCGSIQSEQREYCPGIHGRQFGGDDQSDCRGVCRKIRSKEPGNDTEPAGRAGNDSRGWKADVACTGEYREQCRQVRNARNTCICGSVGDGGGCRLLY